MYTKDQQNKEAKRIANKAKQEAECKYLKEEKKYLYKDLYKEYIDIVLEKQFKRFVDEEIIRMGKSPKTQREIWDKETNEEFEKSKYKYI